MTAPHAYEVESSEIAFRGRVVSVRKDLVRMPGGDTSQRDVVVHPGAVAVVALDDRDRVLLVRQYRHPVGEHLWELPAGLRDQHGESRLETARRELLEEGGVRATSWHTLVDSLSSPGMTDEALRIYLARDIHVVDAADRPIVEHEELEMELDWVDLDEACRLALAGEIRNGTALIGVLAAARARSGGYSTLRPAAADGED
jgi:ADP-ribose pyrophosphatase